MTIVMNFSGSKYHMYKAEVKKVMGHFGLKWNYGRSGWFGDLGSVKGEFEGSGKPVRLIVTGEGIEKVMEKLAGIINVDVSAEGIRERDVKSYMERNRNGYVERQYKELLDMGCEEGKARRLNGAYGRAFDKVFMEN